jgi:hypothetical protein
MMSLAATSAVYIVYEPLCYTSKATTLTVVLLLLHASTLYCDLTDSKGTHWCKQALDEMILREESQAISDAASVSSSRSSPSSIFKRKHPLKEASDEEITVFATISS